MLTDEPFILAAGELYPSETVKFDKSKILGFVTRYGTINFPYGCACKNQRNTIGDRTGRIPEKTNTKARRSSSTVLEGKVYIEPDYTTISKMKQKQDENHTQVQIWNV